MSASEGASRAATPERDGGRLLGAGLREAAGG